ncbi:LANO_0H02806g1_1 [Lachancea nothofagi CBS 11611]|uniref:LANO_0H02806g1_1 n=1 Tax=Lachancea nothofagi CBS 11611 TaxID=1266666 RepID=A0A1G4KL64_9SACH|nr:LANO_0H02806g1_1 [Lachancea nothofagi CBS 11611]
MLIGPLKPPQISQVPYISASENENDTKDEIEETLQTVHLPYSNCLIVLTTKQILVYNYKPMALVSSSVRSAHSIEQFGLNRKLYADSANKELFQDLVSEPDLKYVGSHRGKVTFYVVSEKNFIFVFQILLNSNPVSIFKENGIPIIDINRVDHEFGQDLMNDAEDDDTLTVFDKKDSHKVIQNGYVVEKQQGFLHFLTRSRDTIDEIPIKKVELRLKIILKFEHNVADLAGISEINMDDEADRREYLMILFPHGLQILELQNFKLKNNVLIDIPDGFKFLYSKKGAYVVSQSSRTIVLNQFNVAKKTVIPKKLEYEAVGKLLDVHLNENVLSMAYESEVVLYDLDKDQATKQICTSASLTCYGQLTDEAKILMTRKGIKLVTNWGNCIVSTLDDDEVYDSDGDYSNFSSFASVGGSLVTTSTDGKLAKWDLWSEVVTPFTDARNARPFILQNENNDLMIFAPTSESSGNVPFQVIKLPTQTINNYVPLVRANGPVTMIAAYVSNKNILLIHNLVANTWHSFADLTFIDMCWIGTEYLFCHSLDDDKSEQLRCYHFPFQGNCSSEISEQLIWEHAVSSKAELRSVHVNTLSKYKLLKLKSKSANNEDLESMFKTAEVLIQNSHGELRTIDIISKIDDDESIKIKVFHQHPAEKIFEDPDVTYSWIVSHNAGYLVQLRDTIFKWQRIDERSWQGTVVLDKVERILDIIETGVYMVRENEVVIYSMEDLWNQTSPMANVEIVDNDYPVAISPDAAIIHSIQFVFSRDFSKVVPRQAIYLDQAIDHYLNAGISCQEIDARYRSLHHYKFSLEKILSGKVLTNEPLSDIINLIDYYDQGPKHSGRLEIISNCLRKIEVEHWDYLFTKLDLTPRNLLLQCIEQDEARVLGVLLMVFLNYDGSKQNGFLNNSSNQNENIKKSKKKSKNRKQDPLLESGSISTVLNDEDLMLQVLRLLVDTAASSSEPEQAREFWDMSFQLVRFIHALDNENKTSLIQRAVQILG